MERSPPSARVAVDVYKPASSSPGASGGAGPSTSAFSAHGYTLASRMAPLSIELLRGEDRLHFAGNCEGRDVLSGAFDVVVCDGFTGNVLLKFLESVGSVLLGVLRAELPRGRRGKVGSAFLRSNLRRIKKRLDHAEHGGALLLGVSAPRGRRDRVACGGAVMHLMLLPADTLHVAATFLTLRPIVLTTVFT